MKKIAIFHYFLQKVAQEEQELLKLDDIKKAMLSVIYVRPYLFRRYISGCSMDYFHGFIPRYALELFLVLAADAEKHGDHLLKFFSFKEYTLYFKGEVLKAFTDDELEAYLEKKLYPVVTHEQIDKEGYRQLFKAKNDHQLYEIIAGMESGNIRVLREEELDMSDVDDDAKQMIDRAWVRLSQEKKNVSLLHPDSKLDKYANSMAYAAYAKHYDFLKERI